MSSGASIADDSIQGVAEISIFETEEILPGPSDGNEIAEYWFLQRSDNWFIGGSLIRGEHRSRVFGKWLRIPKAHLKVRLISVTWLLDDERRSPEVERIIIPGVEIRSVGTDTLESGFEERAKSLWFCLRIILIFALRQPVEPLAEFLDSSDGHVSRWQSVGLEDRKQAPDQLEPIFYPPLENYLAKAAAALLQMQMQRELLHAATYGYAESFHRNTMEGGLVSCVEGLERLIAAYESVHHLSDRNGKSFLPLKERIDRMATKYAPLIGKRMAPLIGGLKSMIDRRNDVLHGRVISDAQGTYVELTRGRAMFELLFLGLLGCSGVETSQYPAMLISGHPGH